MLFNISFSGYLLSTILYLTASAFKKDKAEKTAFVILVTAFIIHALLITNRWIAAKQPPLVSLYESLMFYSWCLILTFLVFGKLYRIKFLSAILSLIMTLIFGGLSLLDKTSRPLLPALKSNWLVIHVISYFIGYAAATFSFVLVIIYLYSLRYKNRDFSRLVDELSFKFIAISFPLLTIGLTTGSVWANVAWGTWWSWDPKETWSLISWLVYATYLHLRFFRGIKPKVAAYINILGFLCIIFTFLGVNYLLSGLHSYM